MQWLNSAFAPQATMKQRIPFIWLCVAILAALLTTNVIHAAELSGLPTTIDRVKPAIVAIGTFQRTRRPPAIFRGTGFVVADGLTVATNFHVLPEKVDQEKKEIIAVFA